jgi:cell division protein FtsB
VRWDRQVAEISRVHGRPARLQDRKAEAENPMPRGRTSKRRFTSIRLPGLRTIILIVCVLAAWVALNLRNLNRLYDSYQARNAQREELVNLRREVEELKTLEASLKKDSFESEKSVRESYRLVRPGEQLILLTPEETDD